MTLTSLIVCSDEATVEVLRRVFQELGMQAEVCNDIKRAAIRQAQERFDLLVLDGGTPAEVVSLLQEIRSSQLNDSTLAIVVLGAHESVREMFSLGINFVLYKPVSYERAISSLRAAQAMLYRDKRRKARATVHTQATVDYAGAEQEKATLVDLAEDGMAVNFGKRFPPTCKVYFQFQLPGQEATVRLAGEVMWQDWNGRAGIQFVHVPQSARRAISKWLQTSLAEAPKRELAAEPVEVEHSIRPVEEVVVAKSDQKAEPTEKPGKPKKEQEKQEAKGREREPAARLRSEPSNRREQTRYACRLGAEVYQQGSSVRNYCHLNDLGPGGCYLEMPLAFAQGSPIEITVRTEDMKLRLSGVVKSSHPGYGMGVSFKLNTPSERDGVQQLIDFVASTVESSS
jgi:CheY-like chemotaxis protein